MHDPADLAFIYLGISIGTCLDTDDPQQEGRIRVQVPAYGDRSYALTEDLPWCMPCSPFMGIVQATGMTRGPNNVEANQTIGPVSYGFWNVPKIGASVVVTCINGDPMNRVWMGCIPTQTANHTMPDGRFFYDTDELNGHGEPEGPLSSSEQPIQPLYENQTQAFGRRTGNYEWRTRGAAHSLAAIDSETISLYEGELASSVPDDTSSPVVTFTESDGNVITSVQGYRTSRVSPDKLDSNVYSWTSPGFHSISMDDSVDNCRIHFRTTSGAQIILDDTNERIYINTALGTNWIEADQDGNIDMFGLNFNAHMTGDINLTGDQTVRLFGGKGIHLYTQGEIRLQAGQDIGITTSQNLRIHSNQSYFLEAGQNVNIKGDSTVFLTSGGALNLLAQGQILETGSQIHLNGPSASQATSPNAQPAFWTNRVPDHEPWGRISTADNFSHAPKYPYDSPQIGRENATRGPFWHR